MSEVAILCYFTELFVSITVFYTPPPGVELGPNEYRAASGPVIVTCTAIGGTEISYQWSSTCRDCPFQETDAKSNSNKVLRATVQSGDTGIHTCRATDNNGNTGTNSTTFTITGK